MNRSGKTTVSIIALCILISAIAQAQSGRGRQQNQPPPKPTPKPNLPAPTVLGVPDGGKLADHKLDGAISRAVLKNGLTVIIRERHSSPLVAVNVSVKAGLVNDPDDLSGMARLTRYLVLKGTAARSGAAIDREVARLGGSLNSRIGYDLTSYSLIAPSESYQPMVELLADLIQNPAFKPEDVKGAAQLALLESRREQDAADRAAIERLFSTAFTANRLKRGAAVSDTLPSRASRDQAMAFYQNFYHPANTVVTIVGDIFSLKALGQVQLAFGNFKKAVSNQSQQPTPATGAPKTTAANSKSAPAAGAPKTTAANSKPAPTSATPADNKSNNQPGDQPANQPASQASGQASSLNPQSAIVEEPLQDKLRYGNSRSDLSESIVTIGYQTPALKADKEGLKEAATLQMMAAVLGLGQGSRLWQGLREGQSSRDKAGVVFEIEANHLSLPGAGMFLARMRVDPGRIDRAEAEYFREIERFRRELIGEAELARARVMLEKDYLDTVSRYDDEAATLARYQIQSGDHKLFDSILTRVRAVTAQEIQQAAAKYLALANASVHEYESTKASARAFTPEKFAELVLTFEPRAAQGVKSEEVKPAVALKEFKQGEERGQASEGQNVIIASVPLPVKDFSVLRGPRAYVREDKAYPKISVGVYFQGGRLIEDKTTSGMTELMLRSMMKSTTTRKFDLIAHELESYGGKIQIVNEPDFFGFTLDVMSRNAENAVKLLLDVIESPFFDKVEVARERDAVIAEQARQRDDSRQRSIELMWDALYPAHPYGLPRFGLPDVVKAANEEKLEAWHVKTIKKQFPLVLIVGDTDGSALVSRIFSEGLKRSDLDKTIKANLPNSYATPEDKIEQRSRQSSALATGFRSPQLPPEKQNDLLALAMFGTMASSGKLVEELRDKQNLTDGVSLISDQRLASGVFFAQIATVPENEQRANEALQTALQNLAATAPSDEEFEQGRNAEIGRYAIALQDHNARTLEYARAVIFGRKPVDVEAQPDLIREVKKTDIKRVAESVLKSGQAGHGIVRGNAAAAQSSRN
ncbi:MAG TPA: insulinase family protein [Blastocatellia bacterium]|nr:insulinase family protein [Blastocatellia bacterium]